MKGRRLFAITLLLALLGGLAGTTAMAESGYYKWTDSYGNPTHSDRPPPAGVEYEFVSTDTGMTRKVTAEESREVQSGSSTVGKPALTPEQSAATGDTVAPQKNAAYCEQAKTNLEKLDSSARIRLQDPDGSIRYLSEEEKEIQRQKARDLIAVHCEKS